MQMWGEALLQSAERRLHVEIIQKYDPIPSSFWRKWLALMISVCCQTMTYSFSQTGNPHEALACPDPDSASGHHQFCMGNYLPSAASQQRTWPNCSP
jgi:hypothetical protein